MTNNTWLIQFHADEAVDLILDVLDDGIDQAHPALGRHTDAVAPGDEVIFWVSGTDGHAGIYGLGTVTGPVQDRHHPRSYQDPDGPWTLRPSLPVQVTRVYEHVVISRPTLKDHPVFADFDLFRMANRPNPFPVTPAQRAVIDALLATA